MPKISVIVPVYKAEKFLATCIESILNQTYGNLEIILVDDGSPDSCGKICEKYALSDSRVKVVHQKNAGVAAARNVGLDLAEGDYVTFVDSDDYIQPTIYHYCNRKVASGYRTKEGFKARMLLCYSIPFVSICNRTFSGE